MHDAEDEFQHHHGHSHGHGHDHDHAHDDGHDHAHAHAHDHDLHHDHDHGHTRGAHEARASGANGDVVVIRPATGISGDMLLAGFARMAGFDAPELAAFIDGLGLPIPPGSVDLVQRLVGDVAGWYCRVRLPDEHAHRTLADVLGIIETSAMTDGAKRLAAATFTLLAEAEGRVHLKPPATVTFHEVGALDSILDICVVAALHDFVAPAAVVCGPLPLCDGTVRCAHGLVPAPAPAVLELLEGVSVRGLESTGETVTPTGIALLKAMGATFGRWPAMTVSNRALVYGTKVFPNCPNGVVFVRGPLSRQAR
ncbi:MAG: LarC family nickel insertion protein [Phyllobacteriaceae bacterium]|nr:LarC family nickel insertion protein [Phyllobacteriaceae bacterium]